MEIDVKKSLDNKTFVSMTDAEFSEFKSAYKRWLLKCHRGIERIKRKKWANEKAADLSKTRARLLNQL